MIKEHEKAVLTVDLPGYNLKAGDVGVVVHVYSRGNAYEIEFFTLDGHTLDVVTVESSQVRPISSMEIMHARPLT
jgi:hypothetical protein